MCKTIKRYGEIFSTYNSKKFCIRKIQQWWHLIMAMIGIFNVSFWNTNLFKKALCAQKLVFFWSWNFLHNIKALYLGIVNRSLSKRCVEAEAESKVKDLAFFTTKALFTGFFLRLTIQFCSWEMWNWQIH